MSDNSIRNFKKRRYDRLMMRADADDDEGQWITTQNGHKVHINAEGEPDMGNAHVLAAMKGEKAISFKWPHSGKQMTAITSKGLPKKVGLTKGFMYKTSVKDSDGTEYAILQDLDEFESPKCYAVKKSELPDDNNAVIGAVGMKDLHPEHKAWKSVKNVHGVYEQVPVDSTLYHKWLKEDKELKASGKSAPVESSSNPVDVSQYKFKNYKTEHGTLNKDMKSWADESEAVKRSSLKNYNGGMSPAESAEISFNNLNRNVRFRDLVSSSSEQGLKDCKSAIYSRQNAIVEELKEYNVWKNGRWEKGKGSSSSKSNGTKGKSNIGPMISPGNFTGDKIKNSVYATGNKWAIENYNKTHS